MTNKHLIALLLRDPFTSGLVTPAATQILPKPGPQIYPKKAPQGTENNYLTVTQTGGEHFKATGKKPGRIGLQNPRFRLAAYALTTLDADAIIDAAGLFLDGMLNTSVVIGGKTILVKAILQEPDEDEDWQPSPRMDEVGAHVASASFRVWCTEEA